MRAAAIYSIFLHHITPKYFTVSVVPKQLDWSVIIIIIIIIYKKHK